LSGKLSAHLILKPAEDSEKFDCDDFHKNTFRVSKIYERACLPKKETGASQLVDKTIIILTFKHESAWLGKSTGGYTFQTSNQYLMSAGSYFARIT
jgi:hypothetical protein